MASLPIARRRAVQRISQNAAHHAAREGKNHQLANVTGVDPFSAELFDSNMHLDHDDLNLGQWARKYHADHGIEQDDTFVLNRVSGHWIVVDILSDKDVSGG